jgi:hypothetical protein
MGPKDYESQFVEVGWGFPGVLLCSRALRWRVPRTVLNVVVSGDALHGC